MGQAKKINKGILMDIHQTTANELVVSRETAKSINFGLLYGSSPKDLVKSLEEHSLKDTNELELLTVAELKRKEIKESKWVRQVKENFSYFENIYKTKFILTGSEIAGVEANINDVDAIRICDGAFEPWVPKPGEWFIVKHVNGTFIVVKLADITPTKEERFVITSDGVILGISATFENCEPICSLLPRK